MTKDKPSIKNIFNKTKPPRHDKKAESATPAKPVLAKKESVAQQLKEQTEKMAKSAFLAEHIVERGDTLSHIALKYYGKATPPYYKLIYTTNRDIIGDDMNLIVPGQKLTIPHLPEELK